jgi:predicted kinase
MLYGFTGAGKTTFAKKLESEQRAVRFTYDEWMHRLYGSNPPAEHFSDYFDRISALIWEYAEAFLRSGQDVVLDSGFWSRASRDETRARLRRIGAEPRLYYLECPLDVMKARVRERTAHVPVDSLWIDEHAFELFKERLEPLGADEEHEIVRSYR